MKQRARTDEDKRSRHADILGAARSVFDGGEIDAFTMDAVAATLGLAKGTLYRYVPTREALLLALTIDEYGSWFDQVDLALAASPDDPEQGDPEQGDTGSRIEVVTAIIVDSLVDRPRLLRLASMVASVLERNVPFDTAREYKSGVVERSAATSVALAARLGCTPVQARRLLVQIQALTVGLYHHAHPAPVVAAVIADPAFTGLRIDFRRELSHGVHALARAAID